MNEPASEEHPLLEEGGPEAGQPEWAGLGDRQKVDFPDHLARRFDGRRWISADPVEFLDWEGAEILLIGARKEVPDDVGDEVEPERENERTSDVLKQLRIRRDQQLVEPLFRGKWA